MKNLIKILFVFLIITSCGESIDVDDYDLLLGEWELNSAIDQDGNDVESDYSITFEEGFRVTVEFVSEDPAFPNETQVGDWEVLGEDLARVSWDDQTIEDYQIEILFIDDQELRWQRTLEIEEETLIEDFLRGN